MFTVREVLTQMPAHFCERAARGDETARVVVEVMAAELHTVLGGGSCSRGVLRDEYVEQRIGMRDQDQELSQAVARYIVEHGATR